MAEQLGPNDDDKMETSRGMPRWVKASLIVVAVLVLTFIVLQVLGMGGRHGPGRHGPGRHMDSGYPAQWRPRDRAPV